MCLFIRIHVAKIYVSIALLSLGACQSKAIDKVEEEADIEIDLSKLPAQLRRQLKEGESRLSVMKVQKKTLIRQSQSLLKSQERYQNDLSSSEVLLVDIAARISETKSRVKLIDQSIAELKGLIERIKLNVLANEIKVGEPNDERLTVALRNAAEVYEELGEVAVLQEQAKLGNREAQYKLGRRLERGEGIEQSDIEALRWYEEAAAQGHEKATLAAGFFYRHGKGTIANISKAITYYRKVADLGDVTAANNLGHIFNEGIKGTESVIDLKKAKRWFAVAATGGLDSAQLSLAKVYLAEIKTLNQSKRPKRSLIIKKMKRVQSLLKRAESSSKQKVRQEAKAVLSTIEPQRMTKQGGTAQGDIRWIKIPKGHYNMGDPQRYEDAQPLRHVELDSFYLSASEVTVGHYQRCVEAGHCSPPKLSKGACTYHQLKSAQLPINCVTWEQAREYAQWVGGDLPTEAQWEYAARSAGAYSLYPWGQQEVSCQRAVIRQTIKKMSQKKSKAFRVKGCGKGKPWPVCSKPEGMSQQGVCDMIGNLWEWTLDEYRPAYEGLSSNGRPVCIDRNCSASPSLHRVIRGGAYMTKLTGATATMRSKSDHAAAGIGFRVVKFSSESRQP